MCCTLSLTVVVQTYTMSRRWEDREYDRDRRDMRGPPRDDYGKNLGEVFLGVCFAIFSKDFFFLPFSCLSSVFLFCVCSLLGFSAIHLLAFM